MDSQLLLRTAGVCDFDPEHLLEVFGKQRKRFVAVLQDFGPDDWVAATRCADWSAHDVVRHLCDCNTVAEGTDPGILDIGAGYDPRVTPGRRLSAIPEEPPAATLGRLVATTEALLRLAQGRLARSQRFEVRLPFGPMDWTVLVLHAYWDSWIHERDLLLARGAEHPTDDDATFYATSYGLFIAAAVAQLFGHPVRQKMTLSGDGGGVFELDGSGRVVTLRATQVTAGGPPAAKVTDALAGRSSVATILCDLPSDSCAALSCLADFFNAPAESSPT
jgi:uncharacterized protein (TIGR03083 family)